MKKYIITIKLAGDRTNYYYVKTERSVVTTQDLFLSKIFSTLSGAKSVMNMLNANHPTLFGSNVTYTIKQVKMLTL